MSNATSQLSYVGSEMRAALSAQQTAAHIIKFTI
jgi:hypothetical protein